MDRMSKMKTDILARLASGPVRVECFRAKEASPGTSEGAPDVRGQGRAGGLRERRGRSEGTDAVSHSRRTSRDVEDDVSFDDDDGMSMGEYEYMYGLCNGPDDEDAIYESSAHHPLEDESQSNWEGWNPGEHGLPEPGLWRVRDGAILKIAEMTDRHLANAIRLFERKRAEIRPFALTEHPKITELKNELERRTLAALEGKT